MNEIIRLYLYLCATVFAAIGGVFAATRQIHMFQQNSYFPTRYISWIKQNDKKHLLYRIIFFAFLCILGIGQNNLALVIYTFALLVYAFLSVVSAVKSQKKAIIKLAFTARIKRMYALLIFIFVLLCLLQFFVAKAKYYWFLSASAALGVFPVLAVFMLWAMLYPAEKTITKHYINDAVRILKQHSGLKVIGITGSYGKTGTKNILYKMLSQKYSTFITPKNYNTTLGVVRAVRESMPRQTEVFICEMGAKKKGDIKELCDLVHPQTGLITSIGPQHLDTFINIDGVISTKFELADAVKQNSGKIYLNTDNEHINKNKENYAYTGYSIEKNDDFYADEISFSKDGVSFMLHLREESIKVTTKLLGKNNVLNIVGSAAIAYDMGVTPTQIAFAVSRLTPVEHRLELKKGVMGCTIIDDAYNANPVGSIEACRVLSLFDNMKKVIITPGLVELGDKEYEHNFNLGKTAAECADIIILVGKNRSKPLYDGVVSTNFDKENLFVASSFAEAMGIFTPLANKDTVLLLENDLPDNYLY